MLPKTRILFQYLNNLKSDNSFHILSLLHICCMPYFHSFEYTFSYLSCSPCESLLGRKGKPRASVNERNKNKFSNENGLHSIIDVLVVASYYFDIISAFIITLNIAM